MTSVTLPRRRSALVGAVALAALAGLAGCDSGDDLDGGSRGPSDQGTDIPTVATVITLQNVGKRLDSERRDRVKRAITEVIDPWFDEGFLGEFPRRDYAAAFAGFTKGAAEDAQRRLDVLSNQAIADRIDSATATRRRVRVDVFAVGGRAKGATAHFVLDFTTSGELEQPMRVRGDLYLAKNRGEWRIFGYDIDQAVAL